MVCVSVLLPALVLIWLLFAWHSERLAPVRSIVGAAARLTFTPSARARADLQAELATIKAAGEPVTIEEVTPPEVPDAENAAVLYQQAFARLNLSPADERALSDLTASIRQPPKRQPPRIATIEPIIANNAAAIELLEAAARRPKCRFPVDWSDPVNAEYPHHAKLRRCSRLLAAETALEARRGRMVRALHAAQVSFAMGEAIRSEPSLLGLFSRYAIQAVTLRALQAALADRPARTSACRDLFNYLQQVEFTQSFRRALLANRAEGIWCFRYVRRNPSGITNLVGGDPQVFKKMYSGRQSGKMLDLDEATYLHLMSEQIPVASKPWREDPQVGELLEHRLEGLPPYCVMTVTLLPIFAHTSAKRDALMSQVGLCQTALALKAYKDQKSSFPASLGDLRQVISWPLPQDPFSGRDFVYRRQGDGFLLYSLGPNLKDDGGTLSQGWDKGDITWRCAR